MQYTELQIDRVARTRKPGMCAWCGEMIEAGHPSVRRAYIFDGFTRDRMHPECFDAMADSDEDHLDDGFMPGDHRRGSKGGA